MSEPITTSNSSSNVAPSLQGEIQSTYAKIKGSAELDNQAIFTRDSKRLDAKARAVYKKLGLEIEDAPGELQMIADDIELDEQARADIFNRLDDEEMGDVRIVADNITFSGSKPAANGQQQAVPQQQPAASTGRSWVTPVLAAMATAGMLGTGLSGAAAYYFSRPSDPPPQAEIVDTNTRGVLELVPEEGQGIEQDQ